MSAFKDSGHFWWQKCCSCDMAWFVGDRPDDEDADEECERCAQQAPPTPEEVALLEAQVREAVTGTVGADATWEAGAALARLAAQAARVPGLVADIRDVVGLLPEDRRTDWKEHVRSALAIEEGLQRGIDEHLPDWSPTDCPSEALWHLASSLEDAESERDAAIAGLRHVIQECNAEPTGDDVSSLVAAATEVVQRVRETQTDAEEGRDSARKEVEQQRAWKADALRDAAALRERVATLEADNAALEEGLDAAVQSLGEYDGQGAVAAGALLETPHPGAALLERLRTAETRVRELEAFIERERNPRCQRQECGRERAARRTAERRVAELTDALTEERAIHSNAQALIKTLKARSSHPAPTPVAVGRFSADGEGPRPDPDWHWCKGECGDLTFDAPGGHEAWHREHTGWTGLPAPTPPQSPTPPPGLLEAVGPRITPMERLVDVARRLASGANNRIVWDDLDAALAAYDDAAKGGESTTLDKARVVEVLESHLGPHAVRAILRDLGPTRDTPPATGSPVCPKCGHAEHWSATERDGRREWSHCNGGSTTFPACGCTWAPGDDTPPTGQGGGEGVDAEVRVSACGFKPESPEDEAAFAEVMQATARRMQRRARIAPAPTSSILAALAKLGRSLRANSGGIHALVTLEVSGDHFDATARELAPHKYSRPAADRSGSIICETGEVPIRIVRKVIIQTPTPEVPPLKPVPGFAMPPPSVQAAIQAQPSAPDVVWERGDVQVLEDGRWLLKGTGMKATDVCELLARALAEAKREVDYQRNRANKAEEYWRKDMAEVPRKAAESMRERAAKECDARAMHCLAQARGLPDGPVKAKWILAADEAQLMARDIRDLPLED